LIDKNIENEIKDINEYVEYKNNIIEDENLIKDE
jgi:hypothetical protein